MRKAKAWALMKTPKWMRRYMRSHPKTFWVVIIILLVLPFSPVTFALLGMTK